MDYQVYGLEDFEEVNGFLKTCYLPAPYQSSLTASQELIRFSLFHEKKLVVGFKDKGRLMAMTVFLKQEKSLFVETLLLSRIWDPSLSALREEIIIAAQSTFSDALIFPKEAFLFSEWKEKSYPLPLLKTALVLGGGGAKGSYQIGAYDTLCEAGITFEIVTGTSVGGLNGGLILQEDLSKAKALWENIESNQILDFQYDENGLAAYATDFLKAAIKNRGISTTPLQNLVKEYISPEKIQQSAKDFFVVTTSFPQLDEKDIFLKDVPQEEVAAWLVASSSFFPGMEMTEINGQKYVDGGYKNNLPQDIAYANGARRMIVIDVKGPGVIKGFNENIPVVLLKTPWNLGEVLYFNGQQATFNMALGKLEMEKALYLSFGYWYTFSGKIKQKQYLFYQSFLKKHPEIQVEGRVYQDLTASYGKKVLPYNIGIALLEILGQYLEVLPNQKYTFLTFTQKLKQNYNSLMNPSEDDKQEEWKQGLGFSRMLLDKQQFIRLLKGEDIYALNKSTFLFMEKFLDFIIQNTTLEEEKSENGSH